MKTYNLNRFLEAQQYFQYPILGKRLIEITHLLLQIKNKTALEIMGKLDDKKLKSCMTLFSLLKNTNPVFQEVLDNYFNGITDNKTIQLLKNQQ